MTALLMAALSLLVSCKKESSNTAATPFEGGRKIYNTYCIACHNINPTKDGGIGPAIWQSPRELIAAKVLRNQYPDGYKPKRDSKLMTTFPLSQEQIDQITAYLNADSSAY